MTFSRMADVLWGNKAKVSYLLLAAALMLFTALSVKEIWTQEHRWADIVAGMFYRHDFFHPYLGRSQYYDKPLLSYWLIILFTKLTGQLSTLSLRLPSALAGMLAVWSIYRLGTQLKTKTLGLMAGWLLLTTYYFIFWARTSSADMLNLGGILFAIAWYMEKRERATFIDYAVFFLIVALTSLCKGLVGAIVPFIAVMTDVMLLRSWKRHLRLPMFLALLPALIVYLLPFVISSFVGGDNYGESGLYLVYRENILRYFHPFDHEGPIYTYLVFLPIYLLPAALIFFMPALASVKTRWKMLSLNAKWVAWTLLCLFLFFTLSGSRRNYYVLPIVPFAILFAAEWVLTSAHTVKRQAWCAWAVVLSYLFLFVAIVLVPAWYYSNYGLDRFVNTLKMEASKIKPWNEWEIVLLDTESKLDFYLGLPPDTRSYSIQGEMRDTLSADTVSKIWPIIKTKPDNAIFISRQRYASLLQPYFAGYHVVAAPAQPDLPFVRDHAMNAPIAFIPEPKE